ncbi:MAG: DNA polymerase beta superfamily protein [Candidatus Njordarchaeia archaeon]
MHLHEVEKQNLLIMKCIAGSHMYGTNTPTSDEDLRGIFIVPPETWLDMTPPVYEVSENNQDKKYYELRRFLDLIQSANPSLIELLYVPEDCLLYKHPVYKLLRENASIFITKKCYYSYSSYAFAQIKKARGKNKKVHRVEDYVNEKGLEELRKLLVQYKISKEFISQMFCKNLLKYLEKRFNLQNFLDYSCQKSFEEMKEIIDEYENINYMLKPSKWDFVYEVSPNPEPFLREYLEEVDVTPVNHLSNIYKLYIKGKGFFRNGQIVPANIPKEREIEDYDGLAYFNQQAYEKAVSEYKSFWEWMANRNENRWVDQENKQTDFDTKNMCHTIRLLFEAEHIFVEGRPRVRLEREQLQFLKDIRANRYSYEYLLKFAVEKLEKLQDLFSNSSLPEKVSFKKVNELYKEMNQRFWEKIKI